MGLLDNFNFDDPRTMGLLQAGLGVMAQAGDTSRPYNVGQALSGGLNAYTGSIAAAKKQKQDELEYKQEQEVRQMQMNEMRRKSQMEEAIRGQFQKAYQVGGKTVNPDWAFKDTFGGTPSGQPQYIDKPEGMDQQALMKGLYGIGAHEQAMDVQSKLAKQAEEFGTAPQVGIGNDGKPFTYVMGKNGTQRRLENTAPRDKMEIRNLGGRDEAYNPYAIKDGQVFNKTATIGEQMTDTRARQSMAQSDRHFQASNARAIESNEIARSEKKRVEDMTKGGQVASFDTMLGTLDRLKAHPGLSRSVGLYGALPTMPGTDSANFKAELETFQSQAFLPMVSQLKGMGALSDAEGKKITAAVGALNPSMGEKAFRESVDRIYGDMEAARGRVAGTNATSKTKTIGGKTYVNDGHGWMAQ